MKYCVLALLFAYANALSFQSVKKELKILYSRLDQSYHKDFYCQAPFEIISRKNKIILKLIPGKYYSPRKNHKLQTIDWEHIMPAAVFGKKLRCWNKGGRKACQKDARFVRMESDMQNIVPVISEINNDRSSYSYATSTDDLPYTQYGNCKVYTDFKNARFYPAHYSLGYIARSYLYMIRTYNISIPEEELKQIKEWNKMYPPTAKEQFLRTQLHILQNKILFQETQKR